mmetsp:Transcript_15701/g.53528  ORF Transcript_15701/g.53528 Transcript_15701/m.53528 type:complete len:91 (-) Transcript_15701:7-279(-)
MRAFTTNVNAAKKQATKPIRHAVAARPMISEIRTDSVTQKRVQSRDHSKFRLEVHRVGSLRAREVTRRSAQTRRRWPAFLFASRLSTIVR